VLAVLAVKAAQAVGCSWLLFQASQALLGRAWLV
jgi:hypothetical protein